MSLMVGEAAYETVKIQSCWLPRKQRKGSLCSNPNSDLTFLLMMDMLPLDHLVDP